MPVAVPLGRDRFVQYLKTDPLAPRQEPARVHEVKGPKRHGAGVAYRLYGPHAIVVGKWTGQPMTDQEQQIYLTEPQNQTAEDRHNGWGRLIRPEEIDTVAGNLMQRQVRRGWLPDWWHWRFYWDRVVVHLVPTHLIHYDTYGATTAQSLAALKYWVKVIHVWFRLRTGWEPDEGKVEMDDRWQPLQVAEMPPDLPESDYDASDWRD